MKLEYRYKRIKDKFILNSLRIVDIDDFYNTLLLNKEIKHILIIKTKFFNEMFLVNLLDKDNSIIRNYYTSRSKLKEASLKELINPEKPIILNKDSKCDYIEKTSESEYSFICEDYGKLIKLDFDESKTLAFFKNNNIIYVYDKDELHNHAIHGVYIEYSEKHSILSKQAILSESWSDGFRNGSFIPLIPNSKTIYMDKYNNKEEYDIVPYYIKTYFNYIYNDNDVIINTMHCKIDNPNEIYLDNLIPELSFKERHFTIIRQESSNDEMEMDIEIA